MNNNILQKVSILLNKCAKANIMIATAESCTGGLLSAIITEIPGSSAIFDRGFITYSNQAKNEMLGVDMGDIEKFGAVSREVATQMAAGAINKSRAKLSVAITGIAGPSGGTADKPVGLVYIASMLAGKPALCGEYNFKGNRQQVRLEAADKAMEALLLELNNYN